MSDLRDEITANLAGHPFARPADALLREAAEQLAAKDAELERLRARIVVWIADDGHPELYEAEIDTDLTDGAS